MSIEEDQCIGLVALDGHGHLYVVDSYNHRV
jgi:hypothetical protein